MTSFLNLLQRMYEENERELQQVAQDTSFSLHGVQLVYNLAKKGYRKPDIVDIIKGAGIDDRGVKNMVDIVYPKVLELLNDADSE